MRGSDNHSRADEYHGRQAVKRSTQAAHEEFTSEPPSPRSPTSSCATPSLYINRELSMLDFFERVVDEARDVNNPLLERVKFVGIVGSILGEFFMVRIAGLRQQVEAGVTEVSADGYTPQKLLPLVQQRAWGLMKEARAVLRRPAAGARRGRHPHRRLRHARRRPAGRARRRTSSAQVFPVLTPLAFDPGRPFPHISNMSHNLAVLVRDQSGEERFARVKVPGSPLPRLVPVPPPSGTSRARARRPRRAAAVVHLARAGHRRQPRSRCSPAWRCSSRTPSA